MSIDADCDCRVWIRCAIVCLFLVSGCARDPKKELLSRLTNSDVAVRRAAVRALRDERRTDEPALAALTKSASDIDMEVRFLSIEALGQAGSKSQSSMPVLKSALGDSEKRVRLEAALAIPKIDPHETSFQSVLIGSMREGDGRTLLAVAGMGREAAWAVPTLSGLLSHSSPQVRVLAARALGQIGPGAASAKPALEAASRDPNTAVQKAAKDALARVEAKPTVGGK